MATDGFLLPNAVLKREGLMERKGFPESYDRPALLAFLNDIKSGKQSVAAPCYSHLTYGHRPRRRASSSSAPDILIIEGLNVLQTSRLPKDGKAVPFVSDFFDFSIYIDADEPVIRSWYLEAFPPASPDRLPRPGLLLPPLCVDQRGGGDRLCRRPVGADQPAEPAREHPADPAEGRPDPAQGRQSPGRGSRAAADLIGPVTSLPRRLISLKAAICRGL